MGNTVKFNKKLDSIEKAIERSLEEIGTEDECTIFFCLGQQKTESE